MILQAGVHDPPSPGPNNLRLKPHCSHPTDSTKSVELHEYQTVHSVGVNFWLLKPHYSKVIVSQFWSDFLEVECAPNMRLEGLKPDLGDQEPFAQNPSTSRL